MKPPRVEDFGKLEYLPDPTFEGDRWLEYSDLYGKATTDASRPTLASAPQGKDEDRKNKDILVTGIYISELI
jgi:hypothetical protein